MTRPYTVMQLLPALDSGGVERSTLEIGSALVEAGHRSLVVSAGGRLVPELEAAGSQHLTLDIGRKSLRTLWRARALRRLIETHRPDIMHARSRLPAWVARLALRGMASPPRVVTTVHGLNSPGRYSAVLTRGERVICVSDSVRRHLLAHYPGLDVGRLRVIERGVDPQAFPHAFQPDASWRHRFLAEYPQLDGGVLLTLPARGTRLKGHADALRLLADLHRVGMDARLVLLGADVAGRADYLGELRTLAEQLGISNVLATTPPRAEVREVLALSDLVLQVSAKPEAFGRTVVEALSLGRPVLGYDHGGVGELLSAYFPAGRVPVGDRTALLATARALLSLSRPLPQIEGLPTRRAMQQATLALYREVLDAPRD